MRWQKSSIKHGDDTCVLGEPTILRSAAGYYVGRLYLHFYHDMRPDEHGLPMPYDRLSGYYPDEESATPALKAVLASFAAHENAEDDYHPEGYNPVFADYQLDGGQPTPPSSANKRRPRQS